MAGRWRPLSGYAKGPDGRLRFERFGDGPPLILLHPLALSGAVYRPLAGRLADRFDVISIDLRGHGGSTWSGETFAISDLAEDVAAVLDALDRNRVSMVGMSMGGCVAQAVAARWPDLVRRMVLADTTAWYGPGAPGSWAQRAESAEHLPRTEQLPFQLRRWFTDAYADEYGSTVEATASVFVATDSAAHAAACRALGAMDLRTHLERITADTLVLAGEDDFATPPAMGKAIANAIPGARFELIEGLRHLSLVERPELADRLAAHLGTAAA